MKNFKIHFTGLAFLLTLLFPFGAIANSDYNLTGYKIEIQVNEDNSFFITERITVHYNVPKHGIERLIPKRNKVVRLDGTKSSNRAKISNINVTGDKFSTYNESGNKVIRIGDPDKEITGYKDIVITYLYKIGNDKIKDFDEFYFNIVGVEWDTSISGIEFTITMPKAFDASKLGFSSGSEGSTGNSKITYNVQGNVISGSYAGELGAGEALTVRLELPEGYFVVTNQSDIFVIISIVLPILFVFIVLGMWYKYGRDDAVIETVEFYPPEGFNSAETGFLYKGEVNSNDVVSLLIYLADKGYITISEIEEKSLFSKKQGFKITKVKEYDGNNPDERAFIKGLFKSKEKNQTTEGVQEVTLSDLKENFYTTLDVIIKNINRKENKQKIFEKSSMNKTIFVILMVAATFALITVKPVLEYDDFAVMIFGLIFPAIGFSFLFAALFGRAFTTITVNEKTVTSVFYRIIIGSVFGLTFGLIPWIIFTLPALQASPVYMMVYIIGLICVSLMFAIDKYMLKRTPYGNEMLGKIKGFKNFLELAEKPKLEELVMQNPAYFYNILPYTYVLGVSNKWIKKFESIAIQPPDWYSGSSAFSAVAFGSAINSAMKSASSALASAPSSSGSSSGSSGGGFSGGGSGGGGGRSW